jgi:hypothetical protein
MHCYFYDNTTTGASLSTVGKSAAELNGFVRVSLFA